ncbi:MAG TPA: SRPBCC family protein [Propionibacteriaceae bacterium]|nr:SRPBCC family protein [Propionibacteriaceae bacterium]
MASFENTVMIGRPIEEVFGFLADFENIPKWNYAIVETRKVSQGPVGVGTIYQQVRSVPSRSEEHFEVTAHNPPCQLEIRGQLGPFPSHLAYALDAVPEGTRVTNSVELELRGGRWLVSGRVSTQRNGAQMTHNPEVEGSIPLPQLRQAQQTTRSALTTSRSRRRSASRIGRNVTTVGSTRCSTQNGASATAVHLL